MTPTLSLLIVNCNGARYLHDALDSALTQTSPDFELLVWDDGSADRSVAMAQVYARQDRRVRVIAADHHGIAAARQAAIAQTSGAYLGWLDSDDCSPPPLVLPVVMAPSLFPKKMTTEAFVNEPTESLVIGSMA